MSDPTMLLAEDGMRRFATLFRRGVDPDRQVSEEWTVRDVATHVLTGLEYYIELVQGRETPADGVGEAVAVKNAELIAASARRPLDELARGLEDTWQRYRAVLESLPDDTEIVWHGGARLRPHTMAALTMGEAEVHGYDVAKACGIPWTISADAAAETLLALKPVLPLFLDRARAGDFAGRFAMRIRTRPETVYMAVAGGALTIEDEPDGKVDCRITGRGHELMLVLYGRLGPLRPALSGQMVAYGRRPWWGLKLPSYFRTP